MMKKSPPFPWAHPRLQKTFPVCEWNPSDTSPSLWQLQTGGVVRIALGVGGETEL